MVSVIENLPSENSPIYIVKQQCAPPEYVFIRMLFSPFPLRSSAAIDATLLGSDISNTFCPFFEMYVFDSPNSCRSDQYETKSYPPELNLTVSHWEYETLEQKRTTVKRSSLFINTFAP